MTTRTLQVSLGGIRVRTRTKGMSSDAANKPSDLVLVQRAKDGDTEAFRELVETYEQRVIHVALGVTGNIEDARDVVQDAFLKAYRNLGSFREQSSFYTWLYRIVMNLSIDYGRKRSRQLESPVGEQAMLDNTLQNSPLRDAVPMGHIEGPETHVERRELREQISAAMKSLSPEHRAVVILREIEGLSYAEISESVGCTKGTVMSRLHHARRNLQKILRSHSSEEETKEEIGSEQRAQLPD